MSLSIAFYTLGCKLNQVESESIVQAFRKEGFSITDWNSRADIYIINTCTVTSKAEQKARRMMRKALKERPHACLIVSGCYAQLDPVAIQALEISENNNEQKRLIVISGDAKASLMDLPTYLSDNSCASCNLPLLINTWKKTNNTNDTKENPDPFRFSANDFSFHSRAFLKIQDGCNKFCSYCRVRLARGPSQCLPSKQALQRLQELEKHGYTETVLTGVNISSYQTPEGENFLTLLDILLEGSQNSRLRISSLDPDAITEELSQKLAHPRIQPHFHLSIQSGSNAILARMHRNYTATQVERAAELIRSAKSTTNPFLACDIIVGFPGETEADFESTLELCKKINFAWIHSFPFSPRPGTQAMHLPDRVPEQIIHTRMTQLLALAQTGKANYIQQWIGKTVTATVEARDDRLIALSDNYLRVDCGTQPTHIHPQVGSTIHCILLHPVSTEEDERCADVYAKLL